MSYHSKTTRRRALAGDMSHGPRWYTAMGSIVSQPPSGRRVARPRPIPMLGSLGADDPPGSVLANPTIADPTVQWQDAVLRRLDAGVATLETAELQKWLQIIATVSIPLSAAIWRLIFKRGISDSGT